MSKHNDQEKLISELATRCSEACTRAAIAALVLTGIAFSLIAPLQKLAQLDAVSRYTILRLQLKYSIDEILGSPSWKLLQAQVTALGEDAKFWPLARIQDSCYLLDSVIPTALGETKWHPPAEVSESVRSRKIFAPHNAQISISVSETKELTWAENTGAIWKALDGLADQTLREKAAKYSYEVRFRIVRWETLLEQSKNYSTAGPGKMIRRVAPIVHLADNLKELTLADLEMLANSELEDVSLFDKEPKSFGIAMPWMSERIGVVAAVPLVGVSLCIVIFYFWLFARHAYRLGLSDTHGTLFAAANEDTKSRLIFALASLVPGSSLAVLSFEVGFSGFIMACAIVTWTLSIGSARCCTTRRTI